MTVVFLLAWLLQTPSIAPLTALRATLQRLPAGLDAHRETFGATAALTDAKHTLRSWVDTRLAGLPANLDARAFSATLHADLRGAGLFCDDCDSNVLGYVDDIRVTRTGDFLVVITAVGVSCGYDESAYLYAWSGTAWHRTWEHEQNTDTPPKYLPQNIHDVQVSAPDASGRRLLMELGSQTICGGAFKNLYAKAWQLDADNRSPRVLDFTVYADDGYPPLLGRVLPDEVLFEYTAGGLASGDPHTAVRHFRIERGAAVQLDPIAARPHDFVLEWLSAPWSEARVRSESAALEAVHAQLHRADAVGDFPEATLRCGSDSELWQVATHLFEGPRRYYLVRWRAPLSFTLAGVSETPYPDCTTPDSRGDAYPDIFGSDLSTVPSGR
jgi:hypothetical protein